MATASYGCVSQYATIPTLDKTLLDNVYQDVVLIPHLLKNKIVYAYQDVQLNRSELLLKTLLTLVLSQELVRPIVMQKIIHVFVFFIVLKHPQ